MYPKIFKILALKVPVLGQIVKERDCLRDQVAKLTKERDHSGQKNKEAVEEIISGYCHCCRQETIFKITGSWLRDQFICTKCSSIPRQRHIQYVLDNFFKGWEKNTYTSRHPPMTSFLDIVSLIHSLIFLMVLREGRRSMGCNVRI